VGSLEATEAKRFRINESNDLRHIARLIIKLIREMFNFLNAIVSGKRCTSTLSKPLHHQLRFIVKTRLNLLHILGRQLAIHAHRLDGLENLLRPTRSRDRRTYILIRQNPCHSQRRDIRLQSLRNLHQCAYAVLRFIPCIASHIFDNGLNVGVVRDTQTRVFWYAVDVFAC
jgi:hypothetical protein